MTVLARSAAVVLLSPLLSACAACSSAPPPAVQPASNAASAPTAPTAPAAPLDGEYRTVEVATVGWDETTTSPVVLLRQLDTGQLVPIWVGVAEAQAIAAALHEVRYPRPMTHDLTIDLIGRLDGHLDELLIHDVVDGTYYGLLRISVAAGGDPLLVDSRPSDGLALALRAGAAIRVAQKILDETPDVDFLAPDEPEQVVRALGLTVVARTPELDGELGLPADRRGLVVLRAIGAAADRGLRRGDLLLEVAGVQMRRPIDLLDALADVPYGDPVTVRYWRDGGEAAVELAPLPPGEEAEPVEASGKVA
ncbi:MAG TPA: bifunctional nuclease domain-containing protein [Thermoanaerobaculia bacterium]|nr:bifunctional nuclease domain-containing protein [Thermoanaerobaculia bacterium]